MKKIILILTIFIIGQSLSMDKKTDVGAIIKRSNSSHFNDSTSAIRAGEKIPLLQGTAQAVSDTEHTIAQDLGYRAQENGLVILQESNLQSDDREEQCVCICSSDCCIGCLNYYCNLSAGLLLMCCVRLTS